MSGMESWTPTEGSPQDAVISPLLANIYLHPLDDLMAGHGYKMARYADVFVVLCQSREEAEAAFALICAWVAENGLSLHPDGGRGGTPSPLSASAATLFCDFRRRR